MNYYKRHLPHWQPEGAEFFITFRLTGSLPKEVVEKLRQQRKKFNEQSESRYKKEIQKKIFQKYEDLLDRAESGPAWLKNEKIYEIVKNALQYYDQKKYDLYAYCIMPNHVHLVFKLLDAKGDSNINEIEYPVTTIMQSIKSYTALECNKVLGRKGAFWQSESFDRVIRDQDELENTIRYTLNNPVKAGLIDQWEDWSHSYCKPEFIETFKSK